MNTTRFYLTICLAFFFAHLTAQEVPASVQQLSQDYQQLLKDGSYDQAATYLHIATSYAMHTDQWIATQNAKVNEDMAMRTIQLATDQQEVTIEHVDGKAYYLFSIPEEIEVSLEWEELSADPAVLSEIMAGFASTYGERNVQKIDDTRFSIQRKHQFMVVPFGSTTETLKIIDFPSGQLDLAYGILPAGVWNAFFPGKTLAGNMPYQQAVKQTIGHYFNLLRAKNYDEASDLTLPQVKAPAQFMNWYQSLDNDDRQLAFWNYRITTPLHLSEQGGKRYAGMAVEWTLMVELTAEMASSEEVKSTRESLEKMYPYAEVSYSDEFQVFSFKVITAAIAVADEGKNNWKLLLEDEANGMSVRQNMDKAILLAVGID